MSKYVNLVALTCWRWIFELFVTRLIELERSFTNLFTCVWMLLLQVRSGDSEFAEALVFIKEFSIS